MNKLLKLIILLILIVFLASYFTIQTGYYDYKLQRKTALTEEQIKKFEQDVKEGKDVDISDYTVNDKVDYSNNLTDSVYKVSVSTNKALKKSIESVFGLLNNLVK